MKEMTIEQLVKRVIKNPTPIHFDESKREDFIRMLCCMNETHGCHFSHVKVRDKCPHCGGTKAK